MPLPSVVERMKREQEELGIAIRVFERMTEGRRKNGAMKAAAAALALPATNGNSHRQQQKRAHKSRVGPLPHVDAPDGLSLKGVPLSEAVKLALQAIRKPMNSYQLHALLKAAGMTGTSTRGVGATASTLARNKRGVKKTAKGWVAA